MCFVSHRPATPNSDPGCTHSASKDEDQPVTPSKKAKLSTSSNPILALTPNTKAKVQRHIDIKRKRQKRADAAVQQELEEKLIRARADLAHAQELVATLKKSKKKLKRKTAKMEVAISELKANQKSTDEKQKIKAFETIIDQFVEKYESEKTRKVEFQNVIPPEQLDQANVLNVVAKRLKIQPRSLRHINTGQVKKNMRKKTIEQLVLSLINRDEYSIKLPGKKDKVVFDGVEYQKIALLYDMKYLCKEYNRLNPAYYCDYKIFRKIINVRPWIKRVSKQNLDCCICKTHQNYQLMLQPIALATRKTDNPVSIYPDELFKSFSKRELELRMNDPNTYQRIPEVVAFKNWQKTLILMGDPKAVKPLYISKLRPMTVKMSRENYISTVLKFFDSVKYHCQLATHQHKAVRNQRDELGPDECTIQMDFAQNWLVGFGEGGEIQSVFFNKDGITVHPVVIHFRVKGQGIPVCQSLCFVSDDRKHDAGAISEIMRLICQYIKNRWPNMKTIHYWTDSPTSQYRNISIMSLICQHEELFGLKCTWSYFEAGHGKGPCDGIGAVAKRKADKKVGERKDVYSAADFVKHCRDNPDADDYDSYTRTKIDYRLISLEDSWAARSRLPFMVSTCKVQDTMKVHSVAVSEESKKIVTRHSACFSACCWDKVNHRPLLDGVCQNVTFSPEHSLWVEHELFNAKVWLTLTKKKETAEKAEKKAREDAAKEWQELEQRRAKAQEKKATAAAAAVNSGRIPKRKHPTVSEDLCEVEVALEEEEHQPVEIIDLAAAETVVTAAETVHAEIVEEGVEIVEEAGQFGFDDDEDEVLEPGEQQLPESCRRNYKPGDLVACVWGDTWYVGEVKNIVLLTGRAEKDLLIDFYWSEPQHLPEIQDPKITPKFYKPQPKDKETVGESQVLCHVSLQRKPRARGYKQLSSKEILQTIRVLFDLYPEHHINPPSRLLRPQ